MKTRLWKFPHDTEKIEIWLNEMASDGFICVGVDVNMCRYTFEQGESGEYTYRYVFFDKCFSHSKSIRYLSFLRENGIECVGHSFQNVILRKKAADGEFNLFTDRESQINYYSHLKKSYAIWAVPSWILIAYFYGSIIATHLNIAREFAFSLSFFVHPLTIAMHVAFLINICISISSFQQSRRYALLVKNLKRDSAVFE
ncbi:MAG: DUF2812 domain-containing protein [Defluviitaleaceae bacterium]|nr:DUF2812 domain-containing protein [Defluviitaleaceae bacterium]